MCTDFEQNRLTFISKSAPVSQAEALKSDVDTNKVRIVHRQQKGELLTVSIKTHINKEHFRKEMSHLILHERAATWETNQLRLF